MLLVHDELDLEPGQFKFKQGGSAKGNNGVRSCIQQLGSDAMPRLRIGIGRPDTRDGDAVVGHVLGPFSAEEQALLHASVFPEITALLRQAAAAPAGGWSPVLLDPSAKRPGRSKPVARG